MSRSSAGDPQPLGTGGVQKHDPPLVVDQIHRLSRILEQAEQIVGGTSSRHG